MPLVYNTLDRRVSVQVAGSWFEFAPGQIKPIHNDDLAHIMCTTKAHEGLVGLPESVYFEPNTPESKKTKEEARSAGITNRIRHLRAIIANLEVSLRKDMDMTGMKNVDTTTMATDGELSAYRELAALKDSERARDDAKMSEIKKLKEKIGDGNN